MIKVSLATLVFMYIIGLGGTIVLFWFILERYIDRPDTEDKTKKSVLRCEICLHEFIDNSNERYVNCPVCSTLLDRDKHFISTFYVQDEDDKKEPATQ